MKVRGKAAAVFVSALLLHAAVFPSLTPALAQTRVIAVQGNSSRFSSALPRSSDMPVRTRVIGPQAPFIAAPSVQGLGVGLPELKAPSAHTLPASLPAVFLGLPASPAVFGIQAGDLTAGSPAPADNALRQAVPDGQGLLFQGLTERLDKTLAESKDRGNAKESLGSSFSEVFDGSPTRKASVPGPDEPTSVPGEAGSGAKTSLSKPAPIAGAPQTAVPSKTGGTYDPIGDTTKGQGVSRSAKMGYVTAILTVAFIIGTKALAGALGYTQHPNYQGPEFSQGMGVLAAASLFFQVAVMAPVLEEVIFRWGMMGGLKKLVSKFWARGAFPIAASLTSLVFVALHETSDPLFFGLRLAGALVLAWVNEKYGLAGSITQHAFYNGAWFALAMAGLSFTGLASTAVTLGMTGVGLVAAAASIRGLLRGRDSPKPAADWALLASAGLMFAPLILWPPAMFFTLPLAGALSLYALLRPGPKA